MKLFVRAIAVFSAVLITGSTLSAEESKETALIDISGTMYLNVHSDITDSTSSDSGDKITTFEIERVYLTLKKKVGDIFSARVTADVSHDQIIENAHEVEADVDNDGDEETVYTDGSMNDKYNLYLKYAYIQSKNTIGPANIIIKFGLIDTPAIGFIDKLADQRWVHKNLLDDSKSLLPDGGSIDNSADMGASVDIDIMKKADLVFAVFNGEGYKETNEGKHDTDEGKAYHTRLSIIPLEELYINGFFRYEGTGVNEADNYKAHMGGGLAWKNDLIMTGFNYFKVFGKKDGQTEQWSNGDKKDQMLIDSWLTITPKEIIGLPFFFMGRFGFGKDMKQGQSRTTFIGTGIGYEFHKNVRAIAWYEQYDSEANDAADNANPREKIYLKAEVSF